MPARTREVPVTLPHPALPLADWADCYELLVPGETTTAISAARQALGHFPAWVRALLWLRNVIVAPFGLRGAVRDGKADRIGIFPILSRSDDQMVLGFNDTHLDFRVVIDVRPAGELAQTVSVTTLVRRNILLGKIYLAVIAPFHRLIVKNMLSRLARPVTSVN